MEADGGGAVEDGGGCAGGVGLWGLAKRESSIRGLISTLSVVRVCLISVPGLPWSSRKGNFRPWTSRKSEKKHSQGMSWSPFFRLPSHFNSKKEEASKK